MARVKTKSTAPKAKIQQEDASTPNFDELIRNQVDKAFADKLRLEAFIKSEARSAFIKISSLTGIVFGAIALAGFFGWNQILERVATNAAAKVADDVALTTAKAYINESASTLVSNTVPAIIDSSVPQMISAKIERTEKQLKKDMSDYVTNQIALLKTDEQSLIDKYQILEAKLSYLPYMAEARGGNRKSYDHLRNAVTNNPELASFINAAVSEVENQYKAKKFFRDRYAVTLKTPGTTKLDEEDYVTIIMADNDWNCDGAINDLSRSKKKEFVCVYVNVVANSKRLDSVYLAIAAIESATNKSFSPIGVDDVLTWWGTIKEQKEFDSPWVPYIKLRNDMTSLGGSVITNKATFLSIMAKCGRLLEKYPKFEPLAKNMLLQIAYSPFKSEIIEEENGLFKHALDACHGTKFANTDKWYCYKALYDDFHGQLETTVISRLKESPSFEDELKKSGLFRPEMFEMKVFDWPSKKKRATPTVETKNAKEHDFSISSKSSGMVGYVTLHIKQGKQCLEIPFIRDDNFAREKLKSKVAPSVVKGDIISWTIDQVEHQYEFNGEIWINAEGESANEVEIPIGQCQIFYERVDPIETDMSFAGIVAP